MVGVNNDLKGKDFELKMIDKIDFSSRISQ